MIAHRAADALHHGHRISRGTTSCTVVHWAPEALLTGLRETVVRCAQHVGQWAGASACAVVEAATLPHATLDEHVVGQAWLST